MIEISEARHMLTEELTDTLSRINTNEIYALIQEILQAKRIFVAGAGRSLLMIKSFAMRLMQMGFSAYVVGETVTPSIHADDLLIIASGSGETGSLRIMAQKAKLLGAKLGTITIFTDASIGKLADFCVQVPSVTAKSLEAGEKTCQPGASTFEQCILLLCDTIIMCLNSMNGDTNDNSMIMKMHANLE